MMQSHPVAGCLLVLATLLPLSTTGAAEAPEAAEAADAVEGQEMLAGGSPPVRKDVPGIPEDDTSTGDPRGLAWDFWVPRDALDQSVLRGLPPFCAGAYLWPDFPYAADVVNEDQPIEAESRRATYWETGEVLLEGDVVVSQGNRTLRAARAELNHVTQEGLVPGVVQIEEPQLILRGSAATLNLDSNATAIDNAEFLLPEPEFRGSAKRLEKDEDGDMKVSGGVFTRCEPTNNNWRVGARSFVIRDGSDFGTARHAVVRVKNVPVFYTPYLSFPVNDERKSGWLFPLVGFSNQNGLEFAPPYYFNLAPNYDATLIPRYFQKRGWGIEGEFRHMSSWQRSRLVGSYLADDKQYDGTFERDDFDRLLEAGLVEGPFVPADRWLAGAYHDGDLGHWLTTVNYTAVSDRDYFRNLNTQLDVAARLELERRAELQYQRGNLDMRLWAQGFQRLDEITVDAYQRLPELNLSYRGGLPGPFEWSIAASASNFDRNNEELTGVDRIVGYRAHVEPRLRLPLSRSWGFFTLAGGYRYTAYDLEDTSPGVEDTPERGIGLGSADAGLFFERDVSLFGTAVVSTIEPRLFYLYQQFEDQDDLPRFDVSQLTFRYQQLWRDNRFTGVDRIGDANQLSVGLTSRLLDAATGREFLRASIGQINYFEDRRVTVSGTQSELDLSSRSQLAAELVSGFGAWRVGGDVLWDPTQENVSQGGAFINRRTDNDHIIHLGYRFQRNNIDQTDVALIWPLSKRYGLIGRWNFDLNSERTIEALAGIEYEDCCWKLRLVARRYLDTPSAREFADAVSRTGVFVQVVFKGLASLDDSVETLLADSIQGYAFEEF